MAAACTRLSSAMISRELAEDVGDGLETAPAKGASALAVRESAFWRWRGTVTVLSLNPRPPERTTLSLRFRRPQLRSICRRFLECQLQTTCLGRASPSLRLSAPDVPAGHFAISRTTL